MRGLIGRLKTQTTPEQWVWVSRAMLCVGLGWLWRPMQTTYPSTWMAIIGLAVFTAGVFCALNFLDHTPRLRPVLPWCVPSFTGGFLNLIVVAANGGYMPAANQDFAYGMHTTMDGASLPWLADWIFGFVSPGDVVILIGVVGMAATLATLARRGQRQLVEQG